MNLGAILASLPPKLREGAKDAFFLVQNFPLVAIGGGATVTTVISAESALLIVGGVRTVTDNTGQVSVAFYPAKVKITDGSQRDLMDNDAMLDNLFGTAQLPALWPYPKFVAAGSSLKTTLTSLDTANVRTVQLVYLGFKIYN